MKELYLCEANCIEEGPVCGCVCVYVSVYVSLCMCPVSRRGIILYDGWARLLGRELLIRETKWIPPPPSESLPPPPPQVGSSTHMKPPPSPFLLALSYSRYYPCPDFYFGGPRRRVLPPSSELLHTYQI